MACSLEATFSRVIDNTVCFQGPHSSLSNFAPVEFVHKGTVYCSSEQAYQAIKAHQCKQPALMAKIMRTQSPYLIKRLGNNINASSEWEDCKEMVMRDILISKFKSSDKLQMVLSNTGQKRLIEASHDKFFGAGFPLDKIE